MGKLYHCLMGVRSINGVASWEKLYCFYGRTLYFFLTLHGEIPYKNSFNYRFMGDENNKLRSMGGIIFQSCLMGVKYIKYIKNESE